MIGADRVCKRRSARRDARSSIEAVGIPDCGDDVLSKDGELHSAEIRDLEALDLTRWIYGDLEITNLDRRNHEIGFNAILCLMIIDSDR